MGEARGSQGCYWRASGHAPGVLANHCFLLQLSPTVSSLSTSREPALGVGHLSNLDRGDLGRDLGMFRWYAFWGKGCIGLHCCTKTRNFSAAVALVHGVAHGGR